VAGLHQGAGIKDFAEKLSYGPAAAVAVAVAE